MAKLGTYLYPDIRFGDAVEIAGRILNKFNGAVTVKGLAWELGMAENSGTLFAKIAALRDFGLVEGRGELRVSDLARKILNSANPEEHREASIQAFQRVELLRTLYERFEGETPDDADLLVALEEITKAPREEIARRFTLIQKHLADAVRSMGKTFKEQDRRGSHVGEIPPETDNDHGLVLSAGSVRFTAPLTLQYINMAISLLHAMRALLESQEKEAGSI